jgi:hypothetical protein
MLFYFDSKLTNLDRQGSATRTLPLGAKDPRRWKLLFMGEVVAVGFQKQDNQRAAVIQCADFTTYWDYLKQHYVNFSNGGIELFESAFLGVRTDRIKFFDVVTQDVHSKLLVMLLKSKVKVNETETKTVTETTTENVLETRFDALLGRDVQVPIPREVTKTRTVTKVISERPSLYLGVHRVIREMFFASNNFYARAFNRLRLGDSLVGIPDDTTSAKLFQLDFFQKFINNNVGGAGGMVSLRQMMEFLLQTVFHTYVTIPCPMLDPTGKVRGFTPDSQKDLIASEIIQRDAYAGATLNYTVIKPDTWFLAPPACNIIFPHQYNSISYQRNYLQEPTRLFMRTSLFFTGKDKWLTERFYAPDFEAFNDLLYRKGGYLERMSQVLLPHEDFVGINAAMSWQSDLGAYVAKGPRRDYLSQLADYEFWKIRFAQRTLNVAGPFNPEVVPGYPGVVLDRVGTTDEQGRHFIGSVVSVVHSIDQSGGWTYVTLAGARVHDEDIDFDGKDRNIEEITSRGADGFLDNRYDLDRIGKEVYQLLFGCGSLIDLFSQENLTSLLGEELGSKIATLAEEEGKVIGGVAILEALYRKAIASGADIDAFTQGLTRRPKADLVQILGLNFLNLGEEENAAVNNVLLDPQFVGAGDPDPTQGFMSVAVNPAAADLQHDTYSIQKTTTTSREVPIFESQTLDDYTTGTRKEVTQEIQVGTETVTTSSTKVTSRGTYGLKEHLEKRQKIIQAYADSLLFRGLRG